jgi:ribosomal protein S18 acetylase RimI-like enzyme
MTEEIRPSITSSITIRPARREDAHFIVEIYERVETTGAPAWRLEGPNPYTTAWIDHVIENAPADQAVLVAEDEHGSRLGYTWVLTLTEFDAIDPHGHIAGVGVAPEAEGRGVGRRLVTAAEEWCRDQSVREVTLHCYVGNERALALYEHLGFEKEWYRLNKIL